MNSYLSNLGGRGGRIRLHSFYLTKFYEKNFINLVVRLKTERGLVIANVKQIEITIL